MSSLDRNSDHTGPGLHRAMAVLNWATARSSRRRRGSEPQIQGRADAAAVNPFSRRASNLEFDAASPVRTQRRNLLCRSDRGVVPLKYVLNVIWKEE